MGDEGLDHGPSETSSSSYPDRTVRHGNFYPRVLNDDPWAFRVIPFHLAVNRPGTDMESMERSTIFPAMAAASTDICIISQWPGNGNRVVHRLALDHHSTDIL